MQKLFVSHSSKDKVVVNEILDLLEENGVECWIAPRDIISGRDYDEEVSLAIKRSIAVLLVLSENSNASKAVKNEISIAFSEGKTIFPVRLVNIQPSDGLLLYISSVQWLDAFDSPKGGSVGRLVHAIRALSEEATSAESAIASVTTVRTTTSANLKQYTYTAVEAAAIWAGIAPAEIRRRMDSADESKIEAEYKRALEQAVKRDADEKLVWLKEREICEFNCDQATTCPEWSVVSFDGDDYHVLQCPEGFRTKPADAPPTSTVIHKPRLESRLMPVPGEFADLVDFEQRLGWIKEALDLGDLSGRLESIRRYDLRNWVKMHFPEEHPDF